MSKSEFARPLFWNSGRRKPRTIGVILRLGRSAARIEYVATPASEHAFNRPRSTNCNANGEGESPPKAAAGSGLVSKAHYFRRSGGVRQSAYAYQSR